MCSLLVKLTSSFPTQLLPLAIDAWGSGCNSCCSFVELGFPVSVPCFLLCLVWFGWGFFFPFILSSRDRITQDT